MSSGLIQYENSASPRWYFKQWSGADGKYSGKLLNRHQYSVTIRTAKATPRNNGSMLHPYSYAKVPDPLGANDYLECSSRLADLIRGHTFQFGCFLGELHQTADMVVGNLYKVRKAFRSLKHGDFATTARWLFGTSNHPLAPHPRMLKGKDLANQWLEYRYGWIPLYGDIYEAATKTSKTFDRPRIEVVRASLSRTQASSGRWYDSATWNCYIDWTGTRKAKIIMTARISEQLSIPRSLGLVDPLSVAWELMPLSFCVDWVYPVGSYFNTLSVLPYATTDIVTSVIREEASFSSYWNNWYPPTSGGTTSETNFTYNRSAPSSGFYVKPTFDMSGFTESAGRVENAIALLGQAFL